VSGAATPAIEVRGFRLAVGERVLLEDAAFRVEAGEVVLLCGLSGSGKSITLKLLLDLMDRHDTAIRVQGELLLFGEDAAVAARRRAGIVFQDFGLFDEWSPRQNVLFGADHRRQVRAKGAPAAATADALLAELNLPGAGKVATLSGGQKQRCALARTLAFDPEIIFYDEPTSGLDPAMAAQVAARIRQANDQHRKTSLIVTHDLGALAHVADRVILLDPLRKSFRDLLPAHAEAALAELSAASTPAAAPALGKPALPLRAAHGAVRFFDASARVLEATALAAWALVPRWPRLDWGLRYFWYYLRLTTLGSALGYVAVAGFALGVLVTYFTYNYLPFRAYTEPLVLDSVTGAIGYALWRIMAPGMTAMLLAARSGAAIAADIGHRVYTRQTDAVRSFGVEPRRYFLTNVLWAHLAGMPLLLAVNFSMAALGSLWIFTLVHPEQSTHFWSIEVTRLLSRGAGAYWEGTAGVFWKSLISALGIAAIAYFMGARPKASGRDVSHAVTGTIIWSTLFVLGVQLIAALIEFRPT
jgi:ABC-type polar amino acid transport system ATPase subunit/ABC-type transporter Mla maintaining outer membrane lipid asymmetry permease subunit MlaE